MGRPRVWSGPRGCRGTGSGVQRAAGGRGGRTNLPLPRERDFSSSTLKIPQPVSAGSAPGQDLQAGVVINNSSCLLLSIYLVPGAALTLTASSVTFTTLGIGVIGSLQEAIEDRGRVRFHPNSHVRDSSPSRWAVNPSALTHAELVVPIHSA